jgi:hypothetical protein
MKPSEDPSATKAKVRKLIGIFFPKIPKYSIFEPRMAIIAWIFL